MADLTPGEKRWTIIHGGEKQALAELHRGVAMFLNYVLPVRGATEVDLKSWKPLGSPDRRYQPPVEHAIVIGTRTSNRIIADLLARHAVPAPTAAQGFTLWIGNYRENRLIVVAGFDAAGLYFGVQELLAMLSDNYAPLDKPQQRRESLVKLADTSRVEAPVVKERGIWTWGYVIYDYRRFLDNMARLKFNMLTIWNSEAPVNLTEICDYAHARGIKVIAGFNWGWGYKRDISSSDGRAFIKKLALDAYREEYLSTPLDGIYFQTETEHKTQEINGRSVAAWCCDMVNEISNEFYAINPQLSIQFGLHATSIRSHYTDLAGLDPRIIITWEDAGALPYSYQPNPEFDDSYENTLAYSKQLAAFRPGTPFALVPKGWLSLRWNDEFAKHGPLLLGERDSAYLRERLEARQGELNAINSGWFRHFPLAARFYREVSGINSNVWATALIEDVMFDAKIQPSMSLLGEMLWNPHQPDNEILARAMRPYVTPTTV
ncbi:MAG: hypothetical protein PCFJNLEI_00107 [Verrucomicrobiae bacterium]|nr:hypothetical protein [Verrucomicrobiae bacterium]